MKIRTFKTGAIRNDDQGRIDPEGFYSPLVIERFSQYMAKHRLQADGKLRDSDNWQKGFTLESYMKSKWRHFLTTWKIHRKVSDEDIEESLCAELFNTQGYLYEILKKKS